MLRSSKLVRLAKEFGMVPLMFPLRPRSNVVNLMSFPNDAGNVPMTALPLKWNNSRDLKLPTDDGIVLLDMAVPAKVSSPTSPI
jgi:hypothetical protein